MKKRIVDILSSMNGGITKNKNGNTILHYAEYKDGVIQHKTKNVTAVFTEIEDTWELSSIPVHPHSPHCQNVAASKISNKENSVYDKSWVFVSILHRILIDSQIPKCGVVIYQEEDEGNIRTTGICEVWEK